MTRTATHIIPVLLILLAGCAAPAAKGPFHLYPVEVNAPNYSAKSNEVSFTTKGIKLTAVQIGQKEAGGVSAVLDGLIEKKYLIVKLRIENNSSTERAIFDPVFTAITDDALNYSKPLNYSDLYDIIKESDMSGNSLAPLKGKFYDISLTIMPGDRASRYLIFRPVSHEAASVVIELRNIYLGSSTFDVIFPFDLKPGNI